MLPGWSNGFIAGGFGPLISITQVLSSTSTAQTITAPSGIQAGDLLVLADMACNTSGAPAAVTPTGWTAVTASVTTSVIRQCSSYKLAVGNEGGTSITGMTGTGSVAKVMQVFRGNSPATSVTLGDPDAQATSNDPSSQTVTAASGVAPLVVFGFYGAVSSGVSAGFLTPRTFTSASGGKDGELSSFANATNDTEVWLAWKIFNTAPVDCTVDMGNVDLNSLMSCYIQMARP